ncbi:MAG: diphosphomevalonate decarboxylase [Gammaproteobacteria bacterium]|nr:MAG: diphosphomevalonate decarboxylase [Gammaproteobacteria bacterium]
MRATAIAHPNIALIKYWGKRDAAENLPAVGSLSVTLDAMRARTTVEFDSGLQQDTVRLDGAEDAGTTQRVSACLDRLRQRAGRSWRARVDSDNDFPTGAGLASSAAGFAALATAAAAALDLRLAPGELADIARIGSGSAPRSLFGGFALLRNIPGDRVSCEPLLAPADWPLRVVVAITESARKAVGSRDGMALSRDTSPYYAEWVRSHAADLDRGERAVRARDFAGLADIAEHSCLKMHAVMMTTRPALLYWTPATLACIRMVAELRRTGTPVFFTVDAGPQVKAVCLPETAPSVAAALGSLQGVTRVVVCGLGAGARVTDD